MGGGRRFEYPKWVWTPAGGWWANPKNWKANTAAYLLFSAGVGFVVYKFTQPKIKCYTPTKPLGSSETGHSHH